MKPLSALPVIGLQASFSSPAQHLSKGLISSRLVFFLESFMCLKAFQGWSIAVLTAYTAEHKQSLTFRIIDLRWKQNEMHNRKDYMRGIYLPRQIQALMLRSRGVITQFVVYRLSSFHHGSLCFCVWFPISSNFFFQLKEFCLWTPDYFALPLCLSSLTSSVGPIPIYDKLSLGTSIYCFSTAYQGTDTPLMRKEQPQSCSCT